jgi:hypothetical protein
MARDFRGVEDEQAPRLPSVRVAELPGRRARPRELGPSGHLGATGGLQTLQRRASNRR